MPIKVAYTSLKQYHNYLFTFEKYSELDIERTINRTKGLFKELKQTLNNHNGLKKHNFMFIKYFLNKSYKHNQK
ncbi:transposase [Histophilus somni]|nr:transposase [Histophilus somni]THA45455.1 transposase [Histophilus somni]